MRRSESRKEHKKELTKASCWSDAVSSSGSSSSQTTTTTTSTVTTDHNTTQAGSRIQKPTDDHNNTSRRRPTKSSLVSSSNNNLTILPFWEAHTKTCIDSQRRQEEEEEETSASSLVATSRRVLEYHHDQARVMERPTVAQAVVWNTNAAKQAVIDRLESDQNKSTKKNSSNWWPSSSSTLLLSGTVTKAYNFLMDKDDDDDDLQEEDDNANDNQDLVDFESPLLNVGLAANCCRTIGQHITSTTTTYATALPHVVSGQEGLREWCRQQEQNGDEPQEEPSLLTVISQLPDDQLDFLIAVMVDQNRIVQSNNEDGDDNLLVLLGTNEMENDPVALRSRIDTAVAYFRLDRAQQQTEANLERWRNQIGVALARAQAYKRQGRKAQALTELRKKALWEGHMETAQAALMNLEQTRTALETAANQQELMQDLSTTTETLRATRGNDNSAENVDAVAVDLQEELELLHLNAAEQHKQHGYAVGEDEEELLKELEDLMGEDAEYLEMTTRTTTPAKTEKKKKKKKKESPPRSKPRSKKPSKKEKKSATPPMAASIF